MVQDDNQISRWKWQHSDTLTLLVCLAVAVILAILPHIAVLVKYGTLDYIADTDDALYLTISRPAYYGENIIRDPFARESDNLATLYAWLQFVPLAKLSHFLGFPLILTSLLWRIVGALLIGSSLFFLFKSLFFKTVFPRTWTLICTIVCLCDSGFIGGKIFIQNFVNLGNLWLHHTLPGSLGNSALPQYRVVTPLLNLPLLILLVCVFLPTTKRSYRSALCGIILLGLCFKTYFFFWTASVVSLLFYLAIQLALGWWNKVERKKYLREASFTLSIMLGGFLIGYPELISNSINFSDPSLRSALDRMSRGLMIPPFDPIRTQYIVDNWTWFKIIVPVIFVLVNKIRNIEILILFTLSGYLLKNSAIFTGLEFENYHWNYITSPFGEILLLVVLVLLLEQYVLSKPKIMLIIYILTIALFISSVFWRPYEALNAIAPSIYNKYILELKPLKPSLAKLQRNHILAGTFAANVALLYSQCGQLYDFDQTANSSLINDLEVHERHALNAWLIGLNIEEYKKLSAGSAFETTHLLRPEWQPDAIFKIRREIFQNIIRTNGNQLLLKYNPNYLLLASAMHSPQNGGPWDLVEKTPQWSLWSRKNSLSVKP